MNIRFFIRIIVFFVVMFLCSFAYGAQNCSPQFFLDFAQGGGCSESPSPYPTDLLPAPSCTATVVEHSCLSTVYNVCCELDVVTKYRDDKYTNEIITGVLPGNEADVAQSRFNQWKTGVSLNSPASGFSLTGEFEGFIYGSENPISDGTVNLYFSAWKRGFYTKTGSGSGTVTPIESIGSGGGTGGGLVPSDISGSYTNPYSKGETFNTSRGYKNDLVLVDRNTGDPLTVGPYPFGVDSYLSVSQDPDVVSFGYTSFFEIFADFKTAMQSTSLFSFSKSLFTVPGGGSSVVTINGGIYGNHSFDFADKYSSLFPYIRALVLLSFSAIAVKIILLKGGS